MVYNVYMIRHQIYLTPQLNREIEIQAKSWGKSQSGLIREILEKGLKIRGKQKKTISVLDRITGIAKKSPGDLSTNLLDYLYGGKSPNYGKNKNTTR